MRVGIVIPQGLDGEFAGWEPARAWQRMLAIGLEAEALGFESIWVYDHLGTFGIPRDVPTFEAFVVLGALAQATDRVRLGPLVARAGLRNPALSAKMISTLDVISGGRAEMGLGAGSTGEDADAFGYDLPSSQRMARLGETLEIVRRLLLTGRDTWAGTTYRIDDAINNPRTIQESRIPIVVGGNGPTTMRLAARYADEINLDGPSPDGYVALLPKIAAACEAEGRATASLAVSLLAPSADLVATGSPRVGLLGAYAEAGAARVMAALPDVATNEDTLESFARDVRAAGLEMRPAVVGSMRVTPGKAASARR